MSEVKPINLSQKRREEMLGFLEKLKKDTENSENYNSILREINQIESFINEKKYGLVWELHEEAVDAKMKTHIPVFKEVKEREILHDKDLPFNFLLEGDNLHSLKLLEKTHRGKIDVIYIDPPYNTGNKDFIYNDKYVDKNDGYSHSKWLSFMSERLKIAKNLLSDEGVIFISIDDNEQAQLKLLCDEVFGEGNFLATITVVNNLKGRSDDNFFATCNEYLIAVSKKVELAKIKGIELTEDEIENDYKSEDEQGRYKLIPLIKSGKGKKREDRHKMYYPILYKDGIFDTVQLDEYQMIYDSDNNKFNDNYVAELKRQYENLGYRFILPITGNGIKCRWRWGIDTFNNNKSSELGLNGNKSVCSKMRATLENGAKRLKTNKTTWYKSEYDNGTAGKKLKGLINRNFNNPKSLHLIIDILNTSFSNNSTVLDFFAGSGTTGHAVMQLNKEDGGNRKYILCTNNENNICEEVTYQRLKNIQSDLPHNLKYYKTDFIEKFSSDEVMVLDKMMSYIKELIELEYHINLDDKRCIIVDNENIIDEAINTIDNGGKLFIKSGILLTTEHYQLLLEKEITIVDIPEYYFKSELKEVGEL